MIKLMSLVMINSIRYLKTLKLLLQNQFTPMPLWMLHKKLPNYSLDRKMMLRKQLIILKV